LASGHTDKAEENSFHKSWIPIFKVEVSVTPQPSSADVEDQLGNGQWNREGDSLLALACNNVNLPTGAT
jgi:hypothetical protein